MYSPQIKICGITDPKQAKNCFLMGADAIGCVFYEKSKRNISIEKAKEISAVIDNKILVVGVFVDNNFSDIVNIVKVCSLSAVQLHGDESPELVNLLKKENIKVIKALFVDKEPTMESVFQYDADAFLVECGKGKLPGGNALTWNWKDALEFGRKYPLILAGGLDCKNVAEAISSSLPMAVDVSSGVEIEPGIKDMDKVKLFIENVKKCKFLKKDIKIF